MYITWCTETLSGNIAHYFPSATHVSLGINQLMSYDTADGAMEVNHDIIYL